MVAATNLDLVLESAFSAARLSCSKNASIVIAQFKLAPLFAMSNLAVSSKPPRWTAAEDEFLRRNLGYMTFEEIGAALGRSPNGVELRHERIGIPRPLADPRFVTANRIAKLLGVDAHKVCSWVDRGLLPGEYIASTSDRLYRRVPKITFMRWITNPMNWIWFEPESVAEPQLRRLLARKKELWGDEWWDTGQVAQYHSVQIGDVKRYIQSKRIRAVQTPNRGGRDNASWANWFVLRSEATRPGLVFSHGAGSGRNLSKWSEHADAFLILTAAVGVPISFVDGLCKYRDKRADYRLQRLIQTGAVPTLIQKYDLQVDYHDGKLWADWQIHSSRFPALARAMLRFQKFVLGHDYPEKYYHRHRHSSIPAEMLYVRGVLSAWASWFASSNTWCGPVQSFGHGSQVTPKSLLRIYQVLQSWNFDPLKEI